MKMRMSDFATLKLLSQNPPMSFRGLISDLVKLRHVHRRGSSDEAPVLKAERAA